MLNAQNPIENLHNALAHAVYEGFPTIEYEDRDWEHYRKTKEDKRVNKIRKHVDYDVNVYAMFPQTWGSTALGFGGVGGQAFTSAYVIILFSNQGSGCCVYFGGRFAYHVKKPNDKFFNDIKDRSMCDVKSYLALYESLKE